MLAATSIMFHCNHSAKMLQWLQREKGRRRSMDFSIITDAFAAIQDFFLNTLQFQVVIDFFTGLFA